jgi:hypothetical protein
MSQCQNLLQGGNEKPRTAYADGVVGKAEGTGVRVGNERESVEGSEDRIREEFCGEGCGRNAE